MTRALLLVLIVLPGCASILGADFDRETRSAEAPDETPTADDDDTSDGNMGAEGGSATHDAAAAPDGKSLDDAQALQDVKAPKPKGVDGATPPPPPLTEAGPPPGTSVIEIAAGDYHTCARLGSGHVKCWGYNDYGQLGDTTTSSRSTPTLAYGITDAIAVSTGHQHTCVLLANRTVRCFGENVFGQLGDGTRSNRSVPTPVTALTNVASIHAARNHTCAVIATGGVSCWGSNGVGSIGDGTGTDRLTPTPVVGLAGGVVELATRDSHACALLDSGAVQCWGSNMWNQAGVSTSAQVKSPLTIAGLAGTPRHVATGDGFSCATYVSGDAECWGQVPYSTSYFAPPTAIPSLSGATMFSAAGNQSCAVDTGGRLRCWGDNGLGQLGNGTVATQSTPKVVPGFTSGVTRVSTGPFHACALRAGVVACWGLNDDGQLGATSNETCTDANNVAHACGTSAQVVTGL